LGRFLFLDRLCLYSFARPAGGTGQGHLAQQVVDMPFTHLNLILLGYLDRQLSSRQFLICLFALIQVGSDGRVNVLAMTKPAI